MQSNNDFWADDLIGGRKESATMLYNLLIHKAQDAQYREKEALCFTLDGDWGAGKSFFLERFTRQIEAERHSVVRFDAWVNDLSEQPLLGFMVELRKALETLAGEGAGRTQAVQQGLQRVMVNARKALVPALSAAVKHAVIRAVGQEAVEAVAGVADDATVDGQEVALQAGDAFTAALDGYQDMKEAVEELRMSIAALLGKLMEEDRTKLPLFVVIDELDRCRPNYALRLLEGVKHLFASPNVCFLVATNTKQLSESVRAVYGPGFDGHQYLKKFFAFEFRIPSGSSFKLASTLIMSNSVLMQLEAISGMPTRDADNRQRNLSMALDLVARAFRLPARTVKQVLFVAEAAALGLKPNCKPHAMYLFAVAALAHLDPRALPIALQTKNPRQAVSELLSKVGFVDIQVDESGPHPVALREVLLDYVMSATTDVLTLLNANDDARWSAHAGQRYPNNVTRQFDQEITGGIPHGKRVFPSIAEYPELVITAGCFRST